MNMVNYELFCSAYSVSVISILFAQVDGKKLSLILLEIYLMTSSSPVGVDCKHGLSFALKSLEQAKIESERWCVCACERARGGR